MYHFNRFVCVAVLWFKEKKHTNNNAKKKINESLIFHMTDNELRRSEILFNVFFFSHNRHALFRPNDSTFLPFHSFDYPYASFDALIQKNNRWIVCFSREPLFHFNVLLFLSSQVKNLHKRSERVVEVSKLLRKKMMIYLTILSPSMACDRSVSHMYSYLLENLSFTCWCTQCSSV